MIGGDCADMGPDLWFSDTHDGQAKAMAICATCPVKAECLAAAKTSRIEHGIWGGVNMADGSTRPTRRHSAQRPGRRWRRRKLCTACGQLFKRGSSNARRCPHCRRSRACEDCGQQYQPTGVRQVRCAMCGEKREHARKNEWDLTRRARRATNA